MHRDRTVQICENGNWIEIPFVEIKKDDKFRLFESDGTIVMDSGGRSVWIASCDSYLKFGNWVVNVY